MEKVLPYDRAIVPQETGYWCGPAATQVVLNGRGIVCAEADLAREIGTTTRGTDYVGLIERVLDRVSPRATYTSVYLERDPITALQKERLWGDLVRSINAGYGVVMNWVAPPRNKPRGVKGSVSPSYSGGTTYHYVAAMGYDDDPANRAVWIADSGFRPFGYWCSFDQVATLIPPKGYCYANTMDAPADIPTPRQTPPVALLSKVMGDTVGLDVYAQLLPHYADMLRKINANNNNRIAMVSAQLRHESVGLKYMRELWGPTSDQLNYDHMMGNGPGEGRKYLGRGPIQVTGKNNYRELSVWAYAKGLVPTPNYFVDNPVALEEYRFAFLGAVWYLTAKQSKFMEYADAGNIEDASKAINAPGWIGTPKRANGIDQRIKYWNQARGMDLMPLLQESGDLTMADAHSLTMLFGGMTPDGKPLIGPDGADYRRVDFGRQWTGPDDDPAGPHTTRSTFDEITLLAKLLGQRYTNVHGQSLDVFDLLVSLYQDIGEPKVEGPQSK